MVGLASRAPIAPPVPPAPPAGRSARAAALAAALLALTAAAPPAPAPLGIGDELYPHLGNPGYDVVSYDITLRYSGDNTEPLRARTVILARTTAERLERFNLDFSNGRVHSVEVDGRSAAFAAAGEDLVVTPAAPVERGAPLRVAVRHTSPVRGAKPSGWVRTRDGLVMANQADAAHRVFPGNDHPSDKAEFTFHITTPPHYTAVASGLPVGVRHEDGRTTRTYRVAHPMATELAQVSIGRSEVVRGTGPHGLPLRHVVPRGSEASLRPLLERTFDHLAWMEHRVGRYPFETYGVLAADAPLGFALETQTLSLFPRALLESGSASARENREREALMVHELAHQWFGNSVTPRRWRDLWLNEGHATWYQWLHAAEHGGTSLAERARQAYAMSDAWRAEYGAPAAIRPPRTDDGLDIFTPIVYDGAAVVLYALRQRIGAPAFERLQRAWVAAHRDGVAGTDDFVALAGEVAGQDLDGFLRAWLYDRRTPPMPGHPDWRSAPAQSR